ncbi:HAD-IA family hydrolase [Cereibacter azotoformans]|uniref:HAD superfamily hydrolase (TIGR01509 family) n=1 Tax=Cereibacter azotoformans TaxID=43057 RepID=A0A2T5K311_9RHOB|nr:HAD-IA family hydrolase [Cereibacter azotoformans]AXQ94621.1 HAD family hydrolase [Cereibacter sphaeroides]MBO4170533.1 HAD-IA family hydrolase [Cereibacter azotoformans]PTR16802.1 HAD superfamily hydrolase (TIGR01509 family) [Cereibacter azotoformans]UIJ30179.1 HAD-IA family hydrolase [Cereibacter azotoformans]
MIAAVIFDCDGVLVDSEPTAFALLGEDLVRHGLILGHEELEAHFLGGTIPGAAAKARQLGADLPAGWVEDFYERLYARLGEGTPLIPHVEEVVAALDRAGIPYAVGSNGSDRKMQVTLGQHPSLMARLHGRLFSGQSLGAPKPAPDLYLHAARALGVEPSRCTVVEDSPTGARAARAAGMTCFGYAPNGNAAALAAEGARPFADMRALPSLMGL